MHASPRSYYSLVNSSVDVILYDRRVFKNAIVVKRLQKSSV